jgi:hypothetical protein
MRSSSRLALALGLAAALVVAAPAPRAEAQQMPQGFAVERFYPSAPGGGWFVMDTLEMEGGLGGAVALTFGYSLDALRVTNGTQRLAVVSDEAFAAVGGAITYDRFRFYLDLSSPLAIQGKSGTVGGYSFTGPSLGLGRSPDAISDGRIGFDVRIVGRPGEGFRLGAGAQLLVPNGSRADYDTDDTFRGMFRVLFAGDTGSFTYAGHAGVHVRPLDDAPAPGSPRGHELLFGFAAGARLGSRGTWLTVIGPEVWGATPFRSFFGAGTTAVEGLLSTRFEGRPTRGLHLRVKLGAGIGSDQAFGAPAWRILWGIEGSPALAGPPGKGAR